MRPIILIVALSLTIISSTGDAEDLGPSSAPIRDAQERFPGAISGGIYRQPTQSEIEQRERESRADQVRARQQDREVDDLYDQLIRPGSPCLAPQGCAGK
jgi:hypothetical protein